MSILSQIVWWSNSKSTIHFIFLFFIFYFLDGLVGVHEKGGARLPYHLRKSHVMFPSYCQWRRTVLSKEIQVGDESFSS